jgi:hypothetical protein
MRPLRPLRLALPLVCLAAAGVASAQAPAFRPGEPAILAAELDAEPTYGTTSRTAFVIGSTNFTPRLSSTTYFAHNGMERYITTAGATMVASPMLPNGAIVERVELRACDSDPAAAVVVVVGRCFLPGDLCDGAVAITTGVAQTPGCSNFGADVPAPFPVDNQNVPILVQMETGTTSETTFSAVKIYYRLRVRPAPFTATFPNDVPANHPFFQFVEALASAGITGGCAPLAYCPDMPVTRGQMAVFLAVALGLHFPN